MQHNFTEPHVIEPSEVETKIKRLSGATIFCQRAGCGRRAVYLFRSGATGPIAAYCELHAEVEADRIGVKSVNQGVGSYTVAQWK